LPDAASVLTLAEKVADWQLGQHGAAESAAKAGAETRDSRGWQQAAFYVGLTQLADRSASPRFRDAVIANGVRNGWQLADRPYHADDQAIAQSYLWAAQHGAPPKAIATVRARFDAILAARPSGSLDFRPGGDRKEGGCQQRWCWSDALFMAPPAWFELSRITGDSRYAVFADQEYRAAAAYLFDPAERLFYRDSRFFDRHDANGAKLFWSRGNGWAFAGLARLLTIMPRTDRRRPFYLDHFQQMAARLRMIQRPDGYWSPSLLADAATMPAESSGTGFFVYGLAWGIDHGMLERRAYLPAVTRGWAALTRAVHPDGKLGWVQQVSDRPDVVGYDDTQYYGVGAFLLAGSAIWDLQQRRPH
jgi:rhamnogalacturonyl hydrolase YesR